ncbi:sulfotransferase family protein [Mycobacterium sp.]|uniref:sulfotransferase family protein n=1 Tax=Mycobacterium sp. TaxID=1785 RepID=UPI002C6AD27B|nr:sulfotransferase family protein [Mycobacterium sp.]HTQ19160.1 sulfotransferase family protein [Mycobacterium sp.]
MTPADQSRTAARPLILFVLGVNRSGTSALARVLSLCGGTLPPGLVGAMQDNPLGHWEPREANYLNETILQRHHSTMFDPTLRLQEEGAFDADEKAAWINQIRAYLTTLPAAPRVVVIKDPRITALSDLWFGAARLAGFDVVAAITVRHPQEVVASVAKRSPASPELSGALWLKYNLLAERQTRAVPRVFVEYTNLLDDWRKEMKRISAALGIDLSTRDEGAIGEFLKTDLRRQRFVGPVAELFGSDWISTVYEALCALARDEPWDQSVLDRVFGAYRASEHDFRTVFEDFRRFRKVNRLYPPFMLRLNYKVLEMANRRSGTWA